MFYVEKEVIIQSGKCEWSIMLQALTLFIIITNSITTVFFITATAAFLTKECQESCIWYTWWLYQRSQRFQSFDSLNTNAYFVFV